MVRVCGCAMCSHPNNSTVADCRGAIQTEIAANLLSTINTEEKVPSANKAGEK